MSTGEARVTTLRRVACGCAVLVTVAGGAGAQDTSATTLVLPAADVGSTAESYLRYQQSLGGAPVGQWSVRPFGPEALRALPVVRSAVASAPRPRPGDRGAGGDRWAVAPLQIDMAYNMTYPFGYNDGPVWRGRGLTASAEGGVLFRAGALSVALRPTAFWAENRDFPLMPDVRTGVAEFGDPVNRRQIDRPQRFGDRAYARVSGGESAVRLDGVGVAAGVSTAAQWWGPMSEFPYLLGNNAGGFPHLFLGTSKPVNLGVGRAQIRVIYADLRQSAYTDIVGSEQRRFGSGVIFSFSPWRLDGLELGAARFFHEAWPDSGLARRHFSKPIENFLKRSVRGDQGSVNRTSADNQLASIFARWLFPRSGFEFYGELGREDHSFDERDIVLSPDHQATFGFGVRKAWKRADGGLVGLRAELIDLDPSNLGRNRNQGGKYLHHLTRQGHTERGQLLGSGFSSDDGAGTMVAWDRFGPAGAEHLQLTRLVVRQSPSFLAPRLDVQYVISGQRTRRVRGHAVTHGLAAVYEFNRNFEADTGNLQGTVRWAW